MIFIEGDFFDTIMLYNNPYLHRIYSWITALLVRCAKYNIALRILEGTPSHDMKQPRWFVSINEVQKINADCRYFDTLVIERNELLGLDILYLPDEWDSPLENCYVAAKRAIKEIGEVQVDYVVMHGNFEYQLPKVMGLSAHNSALWQELVRYNILIGHVHTHSTYGKIVASGSLNRLRHREESPKGYCSIIGYSDGTTDVTFLPFAEAKTYTTITVPEIEDTDKLVEFINKKLIGIRPDSHIRWAHENSISLLSIVNYAKVEYPDINFTSKLIESADKVVQQSVLPKISSSRIGIDITKDNISKLLVAELERRGKSHSNISDAETLLQEIIRAV